MTRGLAALVALIAVGGGYWYLAGRAKGCEVNEAAATLYLNRLGVETLRGQFCWASDCRLVAAQMSSSDSASWYCR